MRLMLLLFIFFFQLSNSFAQWSYGVYLKPLAIDSLTGVQSFAFGQYDGKWLILGGRTDGLHIRQPHSAFLEVDNHNQLLVIDPETKAFWTRSTASLSSSIREQLSSTNMSFYQRGDILYCLGGYGYSPTAADHITFDKLTAIDLSTLIPAIVNDDNITTSFRQIQHSDYAVAGGRLRMIDSVFHLLGGQKFTGRYNPMGPDHGPGFEQEYTNAVRRFLIQDDGNQISVTHLTTYLDSAEFHRRDYNAESQIMPNGEEGITLFSGVFKEPENVPFLNSVDVRANGYILNDSFSQYYNHYHCAAVPLYDETSNEMHTLFFGGMAQFYDDNGQLVQDDDVPFVRSIARVSRDSTGLMKEYLFEEQMPGLLGAGSEFIPADLPEHQNGVIKLDELSGDTIFLGHIFGGIESTAPNIFFVNTGVQSHASPNIYKLYLVSDQTLGVDRLNPYSLPGYDVQVFPNPSEGHFKVGFSNSTVEPMRLTVLNIQGQLVHSTTLISIQGNNVLEVDITEEFQDAVYLLRLTGSKGTQTVRLVVGSNELGSF